MVSESTSADLGTRARHTGSEHRYRYVYVGTAWVQAMRAHLLLQEEVHERMNSRRPATRHGARPAAVRAEDPFRNDGHAVLWRTGAPVIRHVLNSGKQ